MLENQREFTVTAFGAIVATNPKTNSMVETHTVEAHLLLAILEELKLVNKAYKELNV